ncbi:MAG TPA: hypothetical protein VLT45_05070, partial [Kofleriaceae bacterium]|nr:hypothetical protein [Kofleriaceae bacterium]
ISQLIDDKKVTPVFGRDALPDAKPSSWGSSAKKPAEKNLWAKDLATPPENRKIVEPARPVQTPAPLPAAPLAVAKPPANFDASAAWPTMPAPVVVAQPQPQPQRQSQPQPQSQRQPQPPPQSQPQRKPALVQQPLAFEQEAPTIAAPPPVFAPAPVPQPMIAAGSEAHVAPPPPFVATPSSRWAIFEQLGLGAPKLDPKQWTKHVVSAYRLMGFAILTIIVMVLIGYIATTAFFYVSNSWVVPMAVSGTDEKVLSLQQQLAAQQTSRDRTAADLADAERAIAVQQEFQTEFAKAIKSDLDGRKAALDRMHQLSNAAASTRARIRRSNNAYASASQRQMAAEWRAGHIDRQQMLAGKFQVAQISSSNLSLAERQAEYETRAADLEAQTRSLEALLANTTTDAAISYDVLKIKQEYEASRLETQKAIENRDMLKLALDREEKLLDTLEHTSYLRALGDHAQVAFVPYGNLTKVEKGKGLYACKLGMVICHKVGTVLEVLPGEVQ